MDTVALFVCIRMIICDVFDSFLLFSVESLGIKDLSMTLFEQAVGTMFVIDHAGNKITSKAMTLLKVSSCFGNHKASLLLAAIHLSGLGSAVDQQQVESILPYTLIATSSHVAPLL